MAFLEMSTMELKFGSQAEVEATIRGLHADLTNATGQIVDLKEANRRLQESLDVASKRGDAAPVAKYLDREGKAILKGFDVYPDGRHVSDSWADVAGQPVLHVHGYLDDPKPVDDLQAAIQERVDARNLCRTIMVGKNGRTAGYAPSTPALDTEIQRLVAQAPEAVRRAFSDTTNAGAELIPTDTLPMVERALSQLYERMVPGLFPEIQVQRDITLPLFLYGYTPYLHSISGDDPARYTSSSVRTSSMSTTLKTLAARTQIGEDAAEEAIVAVIPELRNSMAYALVSVVEDAMLNGDTTATHEDTGLASWNPDTFWYAAPGGGATDHRRAWKGLRRNAVDNSNTIDRSTFTLATLLKDRANVKGPKPPGAVKIICSEIGAAVNFAGITQVLSLEQFGAGALVLSGKLAQIGGMPIVESQFMSNELNASGIFDNSTKTKTGMVLVNTAAWRRFTRYGVRMAMELDVTRGIWNLVGKTRMDFRPVNSSDLSSRYLYNVAIS